MFLHRFSREIDLVTNEFNKHRTFQKYLELYRYFEKYYDDYCLRMLANIPCIAVCTSVKNATSADGNRYKVAGTFVVLMEFNT